MDCLSFFSKRVQYVKVLFYHRFIKKKTMNDHGLLNRVFKELAIFLICRFQIFRDHLGRTTFYVMALHKMNQLSVFEQGNTR